jgi:DNA polymerase III alpha subunit (gram-positive type)
MIILDLETSGLNAKEDKIIEFAAVKIDENLNEIDRLNFFVNPEIQVSNEVLKLT